MTDLLSLLPILLPKVVAWAEEREAEILALGSRLTANELAKAVAIGVANPAEVRILEVPRIPMPEDPVLRVAAEQAGLLGNDTLGMTLGRGIYIRSGSRDGRLVAHECRHVHQYEQHGSIAAFMPVYLWQIVTHGYFDAPLEVDARAWEG